MTNVPERNDSGSEERQKRKERDLGNKSPGPAASPPPVYIYEIYEIVWRYVFV